MEKNHVNPRGERFKKAQVTLVDLTWNLTLESRGCVSKTCFVLRCEDQRSSGQFMSEKWSVTEFKKCNGSFKRRQACYFSKELEK